MGRNYREDSNFAIGTSPAALITLRQLNISVPDQATFQRASVYYTAADMSRVGDGFPVASWIWDVISLVRLSSLLSFLDGKDSNTVYIRTDERDALNALPRNSFKVYQAIMWKPILSGQEGTPIVRTPYAIQSVQIRFVGMVEQIGYL